MLHVGYGLVTVAKWSRHGHEQCRYELDPTRKIQVRTVDGRMFRALFCVFYLKTRSRRQTHFSWLHRKPSSCVCMRLPVSCEDNTVTAPAHGSFRGSTVSWPRSSSQRHTRREDSAGFESTSALYPDWPHHEGTHCLLLL